MITDKVGGSSAKPEVSKQSKEKRPKHKVSGDQSPGAAFYWEPCFRNFNCFKKKCPLRIPSCLIQDGGKKCSCINLYSPCLQSKSWGFHNLAKTFMHPIVYCIMAIILQFAYYYGKRYVVGLWENHSTQIHIHCTCFPGISSIGTKTISYSNTVLEKINKIFSVPESFQVESFQQITWHLLHFEKKNTLTAVMVPY